MNFANVSATMSASLERDRPRRRSPSVFDICTNQRDPLFSFLVRDDRWQILREPSQVKKTALQNLVMRTVREVHSLTYAELLRRASELDAEIPQSPYLTSLAAQGSSLRDLHDSLTEIFDQEEPSDAPQLDRIPRRILQINLAGRQIGRELEKAFGWDPTDGFAIDKEKAKAAITLSVDTIKEITPPYI